MSSWTCSRGWEPRCGGWRGISRRRLAHIPARRGPGCARGVRGPTTFLGDRALYQRRAWNSPAYPTGAFSYSHGLEWAVEEGAVKNVHQLVDFVAAVLG